MEKIDEILQLCPKLKSIDHYFLALDKEGLTIPFSTNVIVYQYMETIRVILITSENVTLQVLEFDSVRVAVAHVLDFIDLEMSNVFKDL
jgi:hypothetical protein